MAPPRSAFGASPPGGPRQRTGGAGSAARAWLAGFALWGLLPLAAAQSRAAGPVLPKAKAGSQCVAEPAQMRRQHMTMLQHQRDETVRGGIRGAKASLKACVECHASPATGSVAKAADDFCVGCHRFAAVKLDCFECHASSPKGTPSAFHVPVGPAQQGSLALWMRGQLKSGLSP